MLLPNNQRLWGRIIICLMGEVKTTSQIALEVEDSLSAVRRETILLNHFGLILPIGIRSVDGQPVQGGYYGDLLWELTEHAMGHDETWDGCRACNLRELLVMSQPR